eukprot:scaffold100613_cov63-Phaeocystis_antarctica.AAC.7
MELLVPGDVERGPHVLLLLEGGPRVCPLLEGWLRARLLGVAAAAWLGSRTVCGAAHEWLTVRLQRRQIESVRLTIRNRLLLLLLQRPLECVCFLCRHLGGVRSPRQAESGGCGSGRRR